MHDFEDELCIMGCKQKVDSHVCRDQAQAYSLRNADFDPLVIKH